LTCCLWCFANEGKSFSDQTVSYGSTAPLLNQTFPLFHGGKLFSDQFFKRIDHERKFTTTTQPDAGAPLLVEVSCGSSSLCFAKACDIYSNNGQVQDGVHIGSAAVVAASTAEAEPVSNQQFSVVICIRTAEDSSALFFFSDDETTPDFACLASAAIGHDPGHDMAQLELAFLKDTVDIRHGTPYEFFVFVELHSASASSRTLSAVSKPAYFVVSRNVSVLVWGDHGGTLKTAIETLLTSGVVPERLFCYHHTWPSTYDYVLRDIPCTRPAFPRAMDEFFVSSVVHGGIEAVMGPKLSYLTSNSVQTFQQFSQEFDGFDVRCLCTARISEQKVYLVSHTRVVCLQVIWIEMPNVHALLFEEFAKHKLVMRSSHRWDHGTPYPLAHPAELGLDWIRPALRAAVRSAAYISVATEWDYWYSRSAPVEARASCHDTCSDSAYAEASCRLPCELCRRT
jgi:hypothetical protein